MFQQITRLILLFCSIFLMLLAISASYYGYDNIPTLGFFTDSLAIVLLLPWYKINTPFQEFTKKPEFLAIGTAFFLVTVWLWVW